MPKHCSISEGHLGMGVAEVVVVADSTVVMSALVVTKEVRRVVRLGSRVVVSVATVEMALETVSVVDSLMLVSRVVPGTVVEDSAAEAELKPTEPLVLASERIELEMLSGLHFPAEAMPTAA